MKKYLIIAFLMAQGFAGLDPSASTDIGADKVGDRSSVDMKRTYQPEKK